MAEYALFANLPPADIRRAAAYYSQLVRDLLARADWLEGQDADTLAHRARREAHQRRRLTTPALIDHHMAAGMTYAQAIDAVARESGLDGHTLDFTWRQARRRAERRAREARDAEIRARARAGESPSAIAAGLKLHPQTVRRILEAPRTPCAAASPARSTLAAE